MGRKIMDLKGMNCPLPVLRANKKIKELPPGEELEAHVTDRAAPSDFREFCDSTGHEFLSCLKADDHWVITLRKKSA